MFGKAAIKICPLCGWSEGKKKTTSKKSRSSLSLSLSHPHHGDGWGPLALRPCILHTEKERRRAETAAAAATAEERRRATALPIASFLSLSFAKEGVPTHIRTKRVAEEREREREHFPSLRLRPLPLLPPPHAASKTRRSAFHSVSPDAKLDALLRLYNDGAQCEREKWTDSKISYTCLYNIYTHPFDRLSSAMWHHHHHHYSSQASFSKGVSVTWLFLLLFN